jgi:hypothetical protein
MAWSTPLTAVANSALTAAQWNASVRDNLLETAPAKATAAGQIFVATGANAIAARTITRATVGTSQTTASTSYADLATAGPSVSVITGTRAVVFFSSQVAHDTANVAARVSIEITGASSFSADDSFEIVHDGMPANQGVGWSRFRYYDTLTGGSNTFALKYKTTSGTATFSERDILVVPL